MKARGKLYWLSMQSGYGGAYFSFSLSSLQIITHFNFHLRRNRYQAAIKCFVVNGRQTKSVSRIEPVLFVCCPRDNVASNDELIRRNAAHAAFAAITRQYRAAKETLPDANTDRCLPDFADKISLLRFGKANR